MTATVPPSLATQARRAYQCDAPVESERAFIERHLPLVKTVVNRMRLTLPATLDVDDLYSVGVTGLLSATQKFDPAQSATFAAFASMHIRGAVLDELRRMDTLSRGCREKAKRFAEATAAVEQRVGRPASEDEVCAQMGISRDDYDELIEDVKPASFVPIDAEVFSEDSDTISLHEILADENQASVLDEMEKQDLMRLVIERIGQLPDVQKKVLAMYYFEEMRVAEIAAAFGVTEGRISQIHTQAVTSLRTFIQKILKGHPRCC
jgi:RNA polymerase sigma factor FliA